MTGSVDDRSSRHGSASFSSFASQVTLTECASMHVPDTATTAHTIAEPDDLITYPPRIWQQSQLESSTIVSSSRPTTRRQSAGILPTTTEDDTIDWIEHVGAPIHPHNVNTIIAIEDSKRPTLPSNPPSTSTMATIYHSDDDDKGGAEKVATKKYATTVMMEEDSGVVEKQQRLIALVAQCLLQSGCPEYRVEDSLNNIIRYFGLQTTISFFADTVIITFTKDNKTANQSIIIKATPGFDMGKVGQINDVMCSLCRDNMNLDTCLDMVQDIISAPPTVGFWLMMSAFTLSSFTACIVLFMGSWMDGMISGMLGLLAGLLFSLANRYPIYGRVYELSASVIIGFAARSLHQFCCFTNVVISATLILLPGYSMAMAVVELSSRHIHTGIIRLVHAAFYAFVLAYGLQMGGRAYGAIDPDSSDKGVCDRPVLAWFYIPFLPILGIAIAISYGSSRKQWISQTLSTIIGFCVWYFGGKYITDSQIVSTLASFAISLYSNIALKITGEAPLIPLSVGITLLVPGSLGVRGAYAYLHNDGNSSATFPLQMVATVLGITGGMFAAAMLVYPTGKKRSMYISL